MTRGLEGLATLVSNIAVQRPARSLCSLAAADRARWVAIVPGELGVSYHKTRKWRDA
jgi:hypothetical protein